MAKADVDVSTISFEQVAELIEVRPRAAHFAHFDQADQMDAGRSCNLGWGAETLPRIPASNSGYGLRHTD